MNITEERLTGSCHCGLVRLTLPFVPSQAISCNCSICRRLGATWAIYGQGTVVIEGHPEHTQAYQWGQKTLLTYRCRNCGCATHWESASGQPRSDCGVNLNNFGVDLTDEVTLRRFDGADTWQYLD